MYPSLPLSTILMVWWIQVSDWFQWKHEFPCFCLPNYLFYCSRAAKWWTHVLTLTNHAPGSGRQNLILSPLILTEDRLLILCWDPWKSPGFSFFTVSCHSLINPDGTQSYLLDQTSPIHIRQNHSWDLSSMYTQTLSILNRQDYKENCLLCPVENDFPSLYSMEYFKIFCFYRILK